MAEADGVGLNRQLGMGLGEQADGVAPEAVPGARVMQVDELGVQVKEAFQEFLTEFTGDVEDAPLDTSESVGRIKEYVEQADAMKAEDRTTMVVDWEHVKSHGSDFADTIMQNFYRLEPFLVEAVRDVIQELHPDFTTDDNGNPKEFYIAFYNTDMKCTLRDLKTSKLGQLISISGTVTRTTKVRPELLRGTFRCADCQTKHENVEQQFKYTEPERCKNGACQNRDKWEMDQHQSVFVDWQRVRVQENSQEIPAGSMPCTTEVILRNEIVERAKPGDKCLFTGTLVVIPDVSSLTAGNVMKVRGRGRAGPDLAGGIGGLKALGVRDMSYRMIFLACSVQQTTQAKFGALNVAGEDAKDTEDSVLDQFTPQERQRIVEMKETPNLYQRMANSVAPQVYGHEEVKRGILLMLFGGVHKNTKDGSSLRGDINVCIVGDPSTSKSQFLKYVTSFLPRAVYTSGKASSAAGLTASVVKDFETGEFTIEAGALMLADNSVCCIDEFDKMDVQDQTAIHEAMEQQTISITKAGIQATLNARTSILAAANPIRGRYDKSRNLKQNVDISPPIMSRFDLFYVVLDEEDELVDYNIANHIVGMHQNQSIAEPDFSTKDLQTYIRFARKLDPQITPEARQVFVDHYKALRANDMTGSNNSSYRITVRQLESMVRLAEALARVYLDEEITPVYVHEAARLLKMSIIRVDYEPVNLDEEDMAMGAAEDEDDNGSDPGAGPSSGGDDSPPPDEASGPSPRLHSKRKRAAAAQEASAPEESTAAAADSQEKKKQDTSTKKRKKREKLVISFEEYNAISQQIVLHLRSLERQREAATTTDPSSFDRTQKQLIQWFMENKVSEENMQNAEEVQQHERKVRNILRRLVSKDRILIVLPSVLSTEEDSRHAEENRVLAVNPNHDVDAGLIIKPTLKHDVAAEEPAEVAETDVHKKAARLDTQESTAAMEDTEES